VGRRSVVGKFMCCFNNFVYVLGWGGGGGGGVLYMRFCLSMCRNSSIAVADVPVKSGNIFIR